MLHHAGFDDRIAHPHLLKTTSFMLVTMFQALYFLVDLHWVGWPRQGSGGVGIAGNLNFITLAVRKC
jgi:hypothetical protein